jgi:hypothetical protein
MKDREILEKVYRQIVLAWEQGITDKAPQHFRDLKEFIDLERSREKKEKDGGGWL